MTEEEYFKKKKLILKEIDKSLKLYMEKKTTVDSHMQLIKQWKDLIKEAKQQEWFKHI